MICMAVTIDSNLINLMEQLTIQNQYIYAAIIASATLLTAGYLLQTKSNSKPNSLPAKDFEKLLYHYQRLAE